MSERCLPIASDSLDSKILKEQVAVVTGAGSGIGFEVARSIMKTCKSFQRVI